MKKQILLFSIIGILFFSCTKDDFTWRIRKRPCVVNFPYGPGGYFISKFDFAGITVTSEGNPYHEYYRKKTAKIKRGETLDLNLGYNLADQNNSVSVYFDWNRDGDFYDQEETILISHNVINTSTSIPITVPDFAELGYSSMRVIAKRYFINDNEDPCNDIYLGEAEDYQIKIY
jgi:hypothetical protein